MIPPNPPLQPPDPATLPADDALSSHTHFYIPTPPSNGTAVPDPTLPLSVDRYILVSELAHGGMGVIYRGRESSFNRELAIKALLPAHAGKPEMIRRAWTEARVTALLEHPGIVPVHSFGHLPDGRPYFSMSLVQGQTLADLLDKRANPAADLPSLLKVFEQVCLAIAYAHSRGVVHRDIKPANVIVAPYGVTKVVDWGVAKVMGDSPLGLADLEPLPDDKTPPAQEPGTTRYGVVLGTAEYMAPEQVRGEPSEVDRRTDVFALGAVLCHMLTGHPPYSGDSLMRVLEKAGAAEVYDAHARLDMCGADLTLVRLAKACLAPERADRLADAGAVADELRAYFESDLRRAERDMARFFEMSLDLFCIADLATGFFKRVNPNFTRVLGYTEGDLLRQPFLCFVHPDDVAATVRVVEQLRAGRPAVRFRNRYRNVRGEYHLLEWMTKEDSGEGLVYAIARDVTPTMTE